MKNKQIANKKLVILGNGFDLNLGMKSTFKDFALSEYDKKVLQENKWENLRPNWYDFEKEMARNYTDISLKRLRSDKESAKSAHIIDFIDYLKKYQNIAAELINYLENEQNNVVQAQNKILSREKTCNNVATLVDCMPHMARKLKEADSILSFNYTRTPQELFGISDDRITYVHGSLKEKNIILGANNDFNFQGEIAAFIPLRKVFKSDVNDFVKMKCPNDNVLEEFKKFDVQYYSYRSVPTKLFVRIF